VKSDRIIEGRALTWRSTVLHRARGTPGARPTSIAEIAMLAKPTRSPIHTRPMHPGAKVLALVAVVALSLSLVYGLKGALSGYAAAAYAAVASTAAMSA
jgi:hypothetical protein